MRMGKKDVVDRHWRQIPFLRLVSNLFTFSRKFVSSYQYFVRHSAAVILLSSVKFVVSRISVL